MDGDVRQTDLESRVRPGAPLRNGMLDRVRLIEIPGRQVRRQTFQSRIVLTTIEKDFGGFHGCDDLIATGDSSGFHVSDARAAITSSPLIMLTELVLTDKSLA
ncbi:MAG TPA: hypothetical protein VKP66_05415 [Steroidobacteraceae bacterium]|nr:hypothetical protein [Steroidobacteraceae bacterium]